MRKSILKAFLFTVVFSAFLTVSAYAESAVVSANDVNLRSGPGLNYSVMDCLAKGTVLTVIERSNSDWYAVVYDGTDGYMASKYISITENTQEIVAEPVVAASGSGYINAMYVRFRSGPSTDYSILGEYNNGKSLTITGTSGDWTAVVIDGQNGYVFSQYVSVGEDAQTSEPEATEEENNYEEPAQTEETTDQPEVTPEPVSKVEVTPVAEQAGYINGDDVRFRSGPATNYSILGSYNRGKTLTIIGKSGDWTAVLIDGVDGFVFSRYVAVTETVSQPEATPQVTTVEGKAGYITGNNVRFRSGPSMSYSIIGEFYYGNNVTITGVSGDWTAVCFDGTDGYVYSTYVREGSLTAETPTVSQSTSSGQGVDVANFALQYVGYNYVWGGKSPDTGFDCSGFVYYVYQNFGYTLNRVAMDQANNGVHVDASALQPGDILCFYSGGDYIGHVGIYIGNNRFVHACNSTTGVIVSELSGYYVTRGFEARRIIT